MKRNLDTVAIYVTEYSLTRDSIDVHYRKYKGNMPNEVWNNSSRIDYLNINACP